MFQLGPDVVSSEQTRIGIQSLDTGTLGGTSGRLFQQVRGNLRLGNQSYHGIGHRRPGKYQGHGTPWRLRRLQKTTLETNINTLNDTLVALTGPKAISPTPISCRNRQPDQGPNPGAVGHGRVADC